MLVVVAYGRTPLPQSTRLREEVTAPLPVHWERRGCGLLTKWG